MILFCIPAGGTNPFAPWSRRLRADIRLHILDLPGRGRKIRQQPLTELDAILPTLAEEIRQTCGEGEPYMLFGYCSGGIVAYELCRYMQQTGAPLPGQVFLFGIGAPDRLQSHGEGAADTPEFRQMLEQFFTPESMGSEAAAAQAADAYLAAYRKSPEVSFSQVFPELSEETEFEKAQLLFLLGGALQQIAQDNTMLEQYRLRQQEPVVLPTTGILGFGTEDTFVPKEDVLEWSRFFAASQTLAVPGDHYAILRQPEPFLARINQ